MTDQNKVYTIAREGSHPAVLTRVIRCGVHNVPGYQGAPASDKPQIALCWELLDEKRDDDKPWDVRTFGMVGNINEYYTEKGKLNTIFRGSFPEYKEGNRNLEPFVGKNVILNMIHKPSRDGTKTYANFGNVQAFPDFMPEPEEKPIGDLVFFDFYKPTRQAWDKLSQNEQEYILQAVDYNGSALAKMLGTEGAESTDY